MCSRVVGRERRSLEAHRSAFALQAALVLILQMNFLLTSPFSYPSGNVAVMITSTEKGKFTYIVYDVSICAQLTAIEALHTKVSRPGQMQTQSTIRSRYAKRWRHPLHSG